MNNLKTTALMALLMGVLIGVGSIFGGMRGAILIETD